MRPSSSVLALGLLSVFACACAAGASSSGGSGGAGGSGSGSGGASSSTSSGGINVGGANAVVAEVFANSTSTLFRLDPEAKVVTTVGDFDGCYGVQDIAIDKDGVMFGATATDLYRIDKTHATCTHIAVGTYPNSLSFVPQGTLDQADEALVGYVGSKYVKIDTGTGMVTDVGDLGSSAGYVSSGDVVSVINGGTYLTVKGADCSDCIVEVDPKTGALKTVIGHLDHANVFGLAFWAGVAYGVDNDGALFQIDLMTAATTVIPTPAAPSALRYWGAGSTTAAPTMLPK